MRRVLIICDTFYPDPMVASVRVTQWCRHLPEHGWKPIVLTRDHGFEATPEMLAKHVHPDVTVEYVNRKGPAGLPAGPAGRSSTPAAGGPGWWAWESWGERTRRALRDAVSRFLVPDHTRVVWAQKRGLLLRAVERHKPDLILTTSPPHGIHSAGIFLTRKTGVPWVADYRDPHVIDQRYGPKGLLAPLASLHRAFEMAVYREAAMIVHAIPVQARYARIFYPFARQKVEVLENGVPAELLRTPIEGTEDGVVRPVVDERGLLRRKSIRVIGTIDPAELMDLGRAVLTLLEVGIECELKVVGAKSPAVETLRREMGDRIVATGYLRHEEALREVAGADVLVSYHGRGRQGNLQLTSKLFEFLATARPIVAVNPTLPDRRLLRSIPGVTALQSPGIDDVVRALRTALGASPRTVASVMEFRERFSRANQVTRLAGMLDKLANERGIKSDTPVPPAALSA